MVQTRPNHEARWPREDAMTMFSNCVCCTPALAAASPSIGRRKFIAGGIAALGLGSAGAPVVRAQGSNTKIDVHHHFLPPEHREALGKHKSGAPKWSVQMSLDDMDKSGIAHVGAVAGPARHLVGRRGGIPQAEPPDQRVWRQARARSSGPLRPVRDDHAARRRRQPQGNRIRLRHAEGRRHRPADKLRRKISRRRILRAGLCRA